MIMYTCIHSTFLINYEDPYYKYHLLLTLWGEVWEMNPPREYAITMESEVGIYSMFFYIKKSIFWYQKIFFYIKKSIFLYQKIDFLISKIDFLISENIFWYQKIFFDIKNGNLFWYKKNKSYFLISKNEFLISENDFLISENDMFFLY